MAVSVCGVVMFGKPAATPQQNTFLDQAGKQWELLNTYCVECYNSLS